MALDKKRPIYFAMDHTSGKDRTICNNIVNKLKNAGLNVVSAQIGPNQMYQNMVRVYNSGKTDAIIFNLFNGVDPSNIREVARNGNDNRGRAVNQRGNAIVLGWFYDSCDPVHENGRCYKSVRGSETGGRLNNVGQYMKNNNIIGICCSSDMHTKMANADYTGDKIAQEFINLFDDTETPEEAVSEDNTVTEPEKVVTSIVTERTYTTPYFMKVIASKTDTNGVFSEVINLPYRGDYIVRLNYAGNQENAPVTRSIHINNTKGSIFEPRLLYTKKTTTYSDNSSEVFEEGKLESREHTKTITETQTYESGTLKNTTTTEVDNDRINIDDRTETVNPASTVSSNSIGTDSYNGEKRSPFLNDIPLSDGRPNVNAMQDGNHIFKWITNKQYRVNYFRDRYLFDSKMLQYKGGVTKYTAFQDRNDNDSYIVLTREVWNAIEESFHYYMVKHRFKTHKLNEIIVDYANKRSKFNGEWIQWKSSQCRNHIVRDRQNTGYTCGPTACSVCSQVLHNYSSEQYMQSKIHATSGHGSDPQSHKNALTNMGFKATLYSGLRKATSHLRRGFPCVWHIYGHYYALCDITSNDYVLASNSSGHGVNGWTKASKIKNTFYGQGVLVEPNWNLSDNFKTKLNHFWNSFGGKWEKPDNTNEGIRQAS